MRNSPNTGPVVRASTASRPGAKINKRMLYHYFGNKDALFLAVLEETYARIRSAERALDLERTEPREAIARLVAFTWHYYLDHPEFIFAPEQREHA